ncbi:MAG: ABC transporter permease [Candidatus Rokubacteria bacterium]|nr:ABC transporter permease [Candidatus Rokubacteria bacterium]
MMDAVRRKPMGAVGAVLVCSLVVMAIFADQIARHNPDRVRAVQRFQPPGRVFWFGTDDFGRDVFSRVVHGARISLQIGIAAVLLGTSVGALSGLISGYVGGRTDLTIQRVMDALMAFPTLVLALAVVAALGASLFNVIVAVALTLIPAANRVVRSVALSVRETAYVMAARGLGGSEPRVVFVHVLPYCFAPYVVIATANLGTAILAEAALGFLGLGVPPPTPAWGSMLSGAAQGYLFRAPWMAIYPGVAISLAVFGFNMFGDALRDVLDPKLKGH